jgi:triacylglycerol lipase
MAIFNKLAIRLKVLTPLFFQIMVAQCMITTPTVLMNGKQIIGTIMGDLEVFLGIPYAEPPINRLRFRNPVKYKNTLAPFNATHFGPGCINQQYGFSDEIEVLSGKIPDVLLDMFRNSTTNADNTSEDCLTINVFRPPGVDNSMSLPVMVWIYGGSFQTGSGASDPSLMIKESIAMNQPIIYVTFNYRLGPWGFLGGSTVAKEGSTNLGLKDQRLALEWVQDNIEYFGGNKSQVLIFGESAGAMSVANHLVAYGGNHSYDNGQLFSAAIMQSGGVTAMRGVESKWPQKFFNLFAEEAGCLDPDSIMQCLRSRSTQEISVAQASPRLRQFHGLVGNFFGWSPRPDGDILPYSTFQMLKDKRVAQVPYIVGTQEDEGTIFALAFKSIYNEDQLTSVLCNLFDYESSTGDEIKTLQHYYPANPLFGAPFRTNAKTALTPQYKRIGALITDFLFEAPRRLLLSSTPDVSRYNYFSTPLHDVIPYLGSFHGNDLFFQFHADIGPSTAYRRYWIAFANHHDPNIGTGLRKWPLYNSVDQDTMEIDLLSLSIIKDNYRVEAIDNLINSTNLITA